MRDIVDETVSEFEFEQRPIGEVKEEAIDYIL